jgi:hypothetical protein
MAARPDRGLFGLRLTHHKPEGIAGGTYPAANEALAFPNRTLERAGVIEFDLQEEGGAFRPSSRATAVGRNWSGPP